MRRWPIVLIAFAILLVGGRYLYGIATKPDDATQIRLALEDAVKASRQGRPGSVIDKIADNFKVNDLETSKRLVADFVKKNHPEVLIADSDPIVTGETAQITSDVTVRVPLFGNREMQFRDAQFLFKKEPAMDWLVIPTTRWQLAAVRVDPQSLPEMASPWSQ